MNGRDLATRLLQRFPGLKVLLTSGYTDEAVAGPGDVAASVGLISKPFTAEELTRRVREALGEELLLDPALSAGSDDGMAADEGKGDDVVEAATPEAFRSLPTETVSQLRNAVVAARHDHALALLMDLEATAPGIAVALRRCVMQFDSDGALALLDRGGTP